MDKEELILTTKQKIDDVSDKIKEIEKKVEKNTNQEIQEQSENSLKELNEIRQKIKKEYSNLGKPNMQNKSEVTEIEKNIFNSIRSFDSAFERAGALFKTK